MPGRSLDSGVARDPVRAAAAAIQSWSSSSAALWPSRCWRCASPCPAGFSASDYLALPSGEKARAGDEREITTMIERNAHFSFAILPGDQSVRGRAGDRSAHREPRPETNGFIRANCRGEVERSSRAVEGFRACQRTPLPAAKQNAARKLSRCRRTAR